jgi:hypothetical protein
MTARATQIGRTHFVKARMEFLLIVLVTLQGDQPAARVIIPPSQGRGLRTQNKSAAAKPRRAWQSF